jgi:phage baseplate assembly protein W
MNLSNIKSVNWQLSNKKLGDVVEGIEDIRQCIQTILTTTRGSDPLRPLFGSDIYTHIDKPVNIAAALISAEIVKAITLWETRIVLKSITYTIDGSTINFEIKTELLESGETTEISFYIYRIKEIENTTAPEGRDFSNGFSFGFS